MTVSPPVRLGRKASRGRSASSRVWMVAGSAVSQMMTAVLPQGPDVLRVQDHAAAGGQHLAPAVAIAVHQVLLAAAKLFPAALGHNFSHGLAGFRHQNLVQVHEGPVQDPGQFGAHRGLARGPVADEDQVALRLNLSRLGRQIWRRLSRQRLIHEKNE